MLKRFAEGLPRRALATELAAGIVLSKSAFLRRVEAILSPRRAQIRRLSCLALIATILGAVISLALAAALPLGEKGVEGRSSDSGAAKPGAAESKQGRPFQAVLPDGTTVELIGVSYNPSEGQPWWKPDGSLLTEAPYDDMGGLVSAEGRQAYEFALRVPELQDRDITLHLPGSNASVRKAGKSLPDVRAWVTSFLAIQESSNLLLAVGAGPWETLTTSGGSSAEEGEEWELIFSEPVETAEKLVITVSHTLATKQDYRIVAVDLNRKVHVPFRRTSAAAGETRQTTVHFSELLRAQVKEFQFQVRPYQWVEFRNVSLKPGHRTDVEVRVGPSEDVRQQAMAVAERFLGAIRDGDLEAFGNWAVVWPCTHGRRFGP